MTTGDQVLSKLESFHLTKVATGKYRSRSPLRPESDSPSFSLEIDADGEHGAYQDFAGSDKGSLYDLAKRLDVALPQRTEVADTKRVYANLEDYARAHGVEAEIFVVAGWQQVVRENRPALQFPTSGGQRWRFIDGQKPKYKSEYGYKRCWYGAQRALGMEAAARLLVLCNGEPSTIVAQHFGVPVICVPGGESEIPNELIKELDAKLWIPPTEMELLIALDCDKKGRDAAHTIEVQFKAMGFTNTRAIDLMLGDKGDLADFCMLHKENVVQALRALPSLAAATVTQVREERRRWRIIHASELRNLPTTEWLIEGELPRRGLSVIFGRSGSGKSFLALNYALQLAQNEPVVYVAAEGESGYRLRMDAWCQHNNLTEAKLYFCLGAIAALDTTDLNEFLDNLVALKPKFVVIDTLARCMIGGDENSTRDMSLFVDAMDRIQATIGGLVLVIHHTNRKGEERGNLSLRNAADTMIKMSLDDDVIWVESEKTKDIEPFETKYFKLLPITLPEGESRVLVPSDRIIQGERDPLTRHQRKILETLTLAVYAGGASLSEIADVAEIPVPSMTRIMSRLIELGYVNQVAKREPYTLTERGKTVVNDRNDRSDRFITPINDGSANDSVGGVENTDQIDQTDQTESLFNLSEFTKTPNYYQKELQS
jgi:DNA-binding MarR family transcriptional regulator